jgi:uncharacterized protein (TIGR02246 family)
MSPVDAAALQRLVDESDLRKLILRLPWILDNREWDAIGELFTEDAVMEVHGDQRKGRDAIVDGPHRDVARLYEATYHNVGNIYVDVTGDEAKVVAYCVAHHMPKASDPTTHCALGGKYHATAVRTEDGWRFHRFRLEPMIWADGVPSAFPQAAPHDNNHEVASAK